MLDLFSDRDKFSVTLSLYGLITDHFKIIRMQVAFAWSVQSILKETVPCYFYSTYRRLLLIDSCTSVIRQFMW